METEIRSIRENPLLDRREVKVEIEHTDEATPSRENLISRIAAENDLDEENIKVEKVYTGFGSQKSRADLQITEEFEYDEEKYEDSDSEDVEVEEEYKEIVSGTITEAKEKLNELENPNFEKALRAEKQDKDRKTLKEWLKSQ